MKQRKRRLTVKLRHSVSFNDPTGILENMTAAERTAYVTRLLRQYIKKAKK